jgi:hypothetical protein
MRRLTSLYKAAQYVGVTERTIRNYVGKGLFCAYRVPKVRGILVDLDEVDAAMRRLPARVARPGYGSFGPKATIIDLPPQPVRVEAIES